jgi:hypothetical protein
MKKRILLALTLALCVLLAVPEAANATGQAGPARDDRVIAGGTFTLAAGETQNGSLLILAGVVTLEEGSRVTRDVVVLGGTVSVSGEIDGSLVAIGGVVSLSEAVVIHGDLIAPASVVEISEQAVIDGQVMTDLPTLRFTLPDVPAAPPAPTIERPSGLGLFLEAFQPVFKGVWMIFVSAVAAALAVLVYVFLPMQTKLVSEAAGAQPVVAGGLGLLAIFVLFPLTFFLGITILLIPVSAALALAAGIAWVFGWVATGHEAGRRVADAFGQTWSAAAQAGIGTFVLTLVIGSIGLIFWGFLGAVAMGLVGSVGLGAVLLTRFGTRAYQAAGVSE